MSSRLEVLERIKECEKLKKFDEHVDPVNYDIVLKVDENFPYIKKGFFGRIKHEFTKWFMVKPFTWYCNKKILKSKIIGKEKFKKIKKAVVTCNHVNIWDCLLVKKAFKKKKLFITAAPFNNRKDFLGKLMRAGDMMPMSDTHAGMRHFNKALDYRLGKKKSFVLFYPEQAMWWNYEKPRPYKNGAFHYAVKYNVPIIPTFITFIKTDELDEEELPKRKFILNVLDPIYPKPELTNKENVDYLRELNFKLCKEKYEDFYQTELSYE